MMMGMFKYIYIYFSSNGYLSATS